MLYADLVARLPLTFRGARYLTGRGLDAGAARSYGFRSIDGPTEWNAVGRYLQRTYIREELAAAGFPLDGEPAEKRVTLPFNGRLPALLIPFFRRGKLIGIRFRNILPDNPQYKHNRYRNLVAAKPLWPFNADGLRALTVHITEGEIDGETLRQLGETAAGMYSAGVWLDHWTAELAGAAEIVDWHDCRDEKRAGDLGAAALRGRLVDGIRRGVGRPALAADDHRCRSERAASAGPPRRRSCARRLGAAEGWPTYTWHKPRLLRDRPLRNALGFADPVFVRSYPAGLIILCPRFESWWTPDPPKSTRSAAWGIFVPHGPG